MKAYFVIYNPVRRVFVSHPGNVFTPSLNYARHFGTRWTAENAIMRMVDSEGFIIKKIAR